MGNAMLVYAEDHDGKVPDAARWCDLLIMEDDMSYKSFTCRTSDCGYGESTYALNIAAAGRKISELPKDMVLVFEAATEANSVDKKVPVSRRGFVATVYGTRPSYERDAQVRETMWNQVCGPERIAARAHEKGSYILFADMHVALVKPERLSYLRWTIDGKYDFPMQIVIANQKPVDWEETFIVIGFTAFVIGISVVLFVFRRAMRWDIGISAGLMAACFAMVFSSVYIAILVGMCVGLLAGFFLHTRPDGTKEMNSEK
jgi:hypothetical protein